MGHRRLAAIAAAFLASAARAEDAGETIVVSATRAPQEGADAPAPVFTVPRARLADSKALDEALRVEPSFGLFRRNSSLVADPSSQGVNLRGVGPSGVSRALVLQDGVPLNDGFGGWVYWTSVPRLSLQRAEIAPGASSALYGSSAMGGVVQLVSRPIADRFEAELQGGSFRSAMAAISLGKRFADSFGASLDAEAFDTRGYDIVASPGAVDHAASSRHLSAVARAEAEPWERWLVSCRAAGFAEDQDGGTQFTTAQARQADFGCSLDGPSVEAHSWVRWARFDQVRSRIAPDRDSETIASSQTAPGNDFGFSGIWRAGGGFLAGADFRRASGRSSEDLHPPSQTDTTVLHRDSPGSQDQLGLFAEEVLNLWKRLQIQAALRVDHWDNTGGIRHEVLASGDARDTDLSDASGTELSPRLGLRLALAPWLSLRAAGYRSFRVPTLNELYRPFQVGPVRTDANPDLKPETLLGAEAGLDLTAQKAWLRATTFTTRLTDPIVNATTGVNQQMRQNLGSARIGGVEVRGQWSPLDPISLEAGWTWAKSRASSGKELPQDPEHRLFGAATFDAKELMTLRVEVRWTSSQFEDDLNTLILPGYAVVNATVSRRFGARWTVFVSGENLLDRRYLVGLQGGLETLGQPICLRAGVRAVLF